MKKQLRSIIQKLLIIIINILPERFLIFIDEQLKYKVLIKDFKIVKRSEPRNAGDKYPFEEELILKVLNSFKFSKEQQSTVSFEFLPDIGWDNIFNNYWFEYRNAISNNDAEKLTFLLRNFFRNEGISGIWGNTNMYMTFCKSNGFVASQREYWMLKHCEVWKNLCPTISLSSLAAPNIGNPWGYDINGVLLIEPVFEYHYQAQYLTSLINKISAPIVLEIGGGFGGLAYFLRKATPKLKYIGFDLPENILLQTYYLSCTFPEAKILTNNSNITKIDRTIFESFDIILLPNFLLPKVESDIADLIINVRSLSEMSFETINTYFNEINRIGRLYFFHENTYKKRLDNLQGIPSSQFPPLSNYTLLYSSESKWPKYQKNSSYPCQENLLIRTDSIRYFDKTSDKN